jgi:chromosome segregation ATPase
MKKYEGLLDEKLDIEERLEIVTKNFDELKTKIDTQHTQSDDLKLKIRDQTAIVEDLTAKVEEEKKVNKVEEEKYRRLAQTNASLRAKLEFIQRKYDFTANVNKLNSDDFKTLVTSNDMVSISILIEAINAKTIYIIKRILSNCYI